MKAPGRIRARENSRQDSRQCGQECRAASDVALLRKISLFRSLSDEALRTLALQTVRRTYAKGSMIDLAEEGEAVLALVVAGAMRAYRLSAQGQEITIKVISPGDVYGLAFVSPAVAVKSLLEATQKETTIFYLSLEVFETIINAYPAVAVQALHLLGERLAAMADRVEDLGLHDVKTRLARTLMNRSTEGGSRMVRTTHEELAREIGVRREEVSRAIADLRKKRLITASPRGTVVIADPHRLAQVG